MGDRGQVHIVGRRGKDGKPMDHDDVWLYTHWGASDLPQTVAAALARGRGRWDDQCYLARIIFSEMVRDDIGGETGYGICGAMHGDVWLVVEVDTQRQTVTFNTTGSSWTFEDFVTAMEEE